MKIKNYTSTVSPEKSISLIEQLLASYGASSIAKDFDKNGSVNALFFEIASPLDPSKETKVAIRLPINHDGVYSVMRKAAKHYTGRMEQNLRDQAMRTSWKLMFEWVHMQLSLVQMQQVELLQVFLPYVMVSREQTFYALTKEKRLIGLPAPQKPE